MSETSMLVSLMQYVLPREIVACFSLVDIEEKPFKDTSVLHLHLDENNVIPVEYQDIELFPNGFYPASTIKDFPLRDRKVVLYVRRRRWIDKSGKSYSRSWELTAAGTRYSKEFASFLKEAFGYQPHPHSIP